MTRDSECLGYLTLSFPRKRGPKATPTGGPEQSEWVSAAHNPKCRVPQNYKDFSFPWIPGASPKMTKEKWCSGVHQMIKIWCEY